MNPSEPPCHADCAVWSATNCPFLANPRAVRRGGKVLGRFLPARKRWAASKPKRTVCGCEHELSYHEPDGDGGGSRCHARESLGFWAGTSHYERCTCKQYTGPRVLDPGYVARELTEGA